MIHLSKKSQTQLQKLGVSTVYFFGSRSKGVASHISDFDFAVLLDKPELVREDSGKLYDKLYDVFSKIIQPETLEADILDIVFLDSPRVPLELKFHVIRHGRLIFDKNPDMRADFEEKTMEAYCDFKPLLDMFDQAVLAKL